MRSFMSGNLALLRCCDTCPHVSLTFSIFRLFNFLICFDFSTFRSPGTFRHFWIFRLFVLLGHFSIFRDVSAFRDLSIFFSGHVSICFPLCAFFRHSPPVPAHSPSRSQILARNSWIHTTVACLRPPTRVKVRAPTPGRKRSWVPPHQRSTALSNASSRGGLPAAAREAVGQARPAADAIARWTATDSCVHQRRAQAIAAVLQRPPTPTKQKALRTAPQQLGIRGLLAALAAASAAPSSSAARPCGRPSPATRGKPAWRPRNIRCFKIAIHKKVDVLRT